MADYFLSIGDSIAGLGARSQRLRLFRNLTQQEVAAKAGVGLKALRRFESSGHGTTETMVRVGFALGVADLFQALFEAPAFNSLEEAEAQASVRTRRRARKRT